MSKTPEYRPSQEDLLGYLLGALDEAEQERVKRYVAGHPQIQSELGKLQRCMLPLRAVDMPIEPPGGLARRSCERIFARAEGWVEPRRLQANETMANDGWQIWDLTMLMSVAILMAMLVMPAVYRSREAARRLACASNLRHLSYAMRSHSEF
jgi:anti-sigma-K factor RskA